MLTKHFYFPLYTAIEYTNICHKKATKIICFTVFIPITTTNVRHTKICTTIPVKQRQMMLVL